MRIHAGGAMDGWSRAILATAGAMVLAAPVVAGFLTAVRLRAQAPAAHSPAVPQWQIAAGGKMAFDVASRKAEHIA